MAIQSYVSASSASAALRGVVLTQWTAWITPRNLIVLLLLANVASSLVWALYRQEGLQDLGSFLHSGTAYNRDLNPYNHHFGLDPQPISSEALNLNPPISVYVFAALALLPQEAVSWTFFIGTILLFAGALYLLLRTWPEKRDALVILTVCSLAGVWHTLGYLQLYAPLILAGIVAWLLMRRGNLVLAGIAIGLIVAVKPNFALWPLLLFAAGHTRVSLSAFATTASVSALPLAIDGPGIYRQWLTVTSSFSGIEWASNASLMSIVGRFGLEETGVLVGAGVVAVLLVLSWRRRPALLQTSSIALIGVLLAGPVSWAGYTLFLLPYLFSRPWNHLIWLSLAMLAMPFWLVRYFTVSGSVPNALLGPMYGWGVLLLFGVVAWELLRQPARAEEERYAEAAA